MSLHGLEQKVEKLTVTMLEKRIAELEAQLIEPEQDRRYKVIFDLRLLTNEELAVIEAIAEQLIVRKQEERGQIT
jgi:hypothetical protein